jgi:excisionase family DNA binding protein
MGDFVMDKLLTPDQAAEKLAVKPRSIKEWLRQGKLLGVKIGKLWRIRNEDLETFIIHNQTNKR